MKKELFKPKLNRFQLLVSAVGITSLSMLNGVEPVKAASLSCEPGNNWITTCQSGIFNFSSSVKIGVNFGFSPNNLPDFTTTLKGLTRIVTSNPLDAIVNDPLLGNVGSLDGQLDVLQTEVFYSLNSGPTPFVPLITARVGDGVPDLAPTPSDPILPYESLYSAGAIAQKSDDPTLADSFFKLFLEIQGTPEGTIRTLSPVTLTGTPSLTGFPGLSNINFVNTEIVPLFGAGLDGLFWTGDEVEVARLVPDADGSSVVLNLTPVPEPSTAISLIAVGLSMFLRCRRKTI